MSLAVALTQLRARRQELDEEIGRVDRAIQALADLEGPAAPAKGKGAPHPPAKPAARSKAAQAGGCGRCGGAGHNRRTCTAKGTKAASDDEEAPVAKPEPTTALDAKAELRRKMAAGLIEPARTPEQAKRAAAARVMSRRQGQFVNRHQRSKAGNAPRVGSPEHFHQGRKLVRCTTCSVSVMAEPAQMQGHLDRAHGGEGGFGEVA